MYKFLKNAFRFKLELCYEQTLFQPLDSKNPIFELLSNYDELSRILQLNNKEIFKFLYFKRNKVDRIFWENRDKIIKIEYNASKDINISYFFYFCLLINSSSSMHYIYPIKDYIKEINDYKGKNEHYKNLILSKIIIDLINNYENKMEKFDEINININKGIIMNIFKDMNIDIIKDINKMNLDEIYIDIISFLIKENKLIDYDYSNDILCQIEIESINITKAIFDQLLYILNENEIYIKQNKINKIDDLFDINKINFYYFLLKYILKNSIYIYNIPFLFNIRKKIIDIINFQLDNILTFNINNNEEKIEYIIKFFCDSEYYYNRFRNYYNFLKLKEILLYYKKYRFESKKEDIIIIEKILQDKKICCIDNFKKDYNKAKKMNKIFPIIKFILKNKNILILEKELNNCADNIWANLETKIIGKNFDKIEKEYKLILINFFIQPKNKEILLSIFPKEIYDLFIKENHNLLDENNDNINGNEKTENFEDYFKNIDELSNIDKMSSISKNDENFLKEDEIKEINNNINNFVIAVEDKELFNKKKKISDKINFTLSNYEMFSLENKIKIKGNPLFIKELSNSYFIIIGESKSLIILDEKYKKQNEILISKYNGVYNVWEREQYGENYGINIIVCCQNDIKLLTIHKELISFEIRNFKIPSSSCVEIRANNHIICGYDGAFHYIDLFDITNEENNYNLISNKSYRGAIEINPNMAAITSNHILPNGEDKILFYHLISKSVLYEINGYSFNLSSNGMTIISNDRNNNKILLCACKKYTFKQKNGILLINIDDDKLEFNEKFYDTGNFEVYCFCKIFFKSEKNLNIIQKENETTYFFVGGFDPYIGRGIIKLCKIEDNIEIKIIQEITFNNNILKGPVNCIIQRKNKGNIIISCSNYIYILSPPNINYISKCEEQEIFSNII